MAGGTDTARLLPKLGVLVLVVCVLGLPINSLFAFALLAASILVVFTGAIATSALRWFGALVLAVFALAVHVVGLAPRIEEGHNVFLVDGPGSALERGLPAQAYRAMAQRFDVAYPEEKRCVRGEPHCWRPDGIPKQAFAFAADGIFDRHQFTRRVTGIDFESPIWLRLGVVNDLSLDLIGKGEDSVERLTRDRRSLAVFGRWQLKLPYFVMYRFPPVFAGSDLCWRGEVLWEGESERFEPIAHSDWACRTLKSADIGRRIFGLSIGADASLGMRLDADAAVKARNDASIAAVVICVVGTLLLLVHWSPRRAVFPLVLAGLTLALVVFTDATFIGGYRPFDGGDDGLIFSGMAREMLEHLAHGDIAGTLQGVERVFYFNPGMRYFRAIEFLLFGDTFLLYLLLMLVMPLIVYAVFRRFCGDAWGAALTLIFMAVPVGAIFGTTYAHYIAWAARGYADPLGALTLLAGLVLIAGPRGTPFDTRAAPAFWGALSMAIAVALRPNLAPAIGVLLGGVGLAALWRQRFRRLAALCLGFSAILLLPWHNWHFGGVFVPIAANLDASVIIGLTPGGYLTAIGELARLDFTGVNIAKALHQIVKLLSGPADMWLFIPLHVAAYAVLVRVSLSSKFEPMLRLTALAALGLTAVGLIYIVTLRYNLTMWFLMGLVTAAWLRDEGLVILQHRRPGWMERLTRWTDATRVPRTLAWLQAQE